jgi:hypothetical protein
LFVSARAADLVWRSGVYIEKTVAAEAYQRVFPQVAAALE